MHYYHFRFFKIIIIIIIIAIIIIIIAIIIISSSSNFCFIFFIVYVNNFCLFLKTFLYAVEYLERENKKRLSDSIKGGGKSLQYLSVFMCFIIRINSCRLE